MAPVAPAMSRCAALLCAAALAPVFVQFAAPRAPRDGAAHRGWSNATGSPGATAATTAALVVASVAAAGARASKVRPTENAKLDQLVNLVNLQDLISKQ